MPAKGALDDQRVSNLSDYEALESARVPLDSVRDTLRRVSRKAVHVEDVTDMYHSNFGNEPNKRSNEDIQSRSNKYWEKYKPILERLYMVDNKPLTEVQSFMAEQHNFKPTPKQYRYQFSVKWGWTKYKPGHTCEDMAHLVSPNFDVENNDGQRIANTDRLPCQFGDSTEKRSRLESEAIANPIAISFRRCSVVLFELTATVISILCAWTIRQYDRSLDIQGTTDKFEQLMVTGNTPADMQQSIHQFADVFDQPLLPILTIALLYAASVSAVYCLHRHDRYLNPLLWLGAVVAIAVGLLQRTGLRATVVQTVPGAVALSLLISAAFHCSVGVTMNQCGCDNGLP